MNLLNELVASIVSGAGHPAFFIHGQYYSYANLEEKLSSIKNVIQLNTVESEKNIGIVTNDDLETYAAIIAIWLEGKAYVPLNPANPKERN
jgi:acyl-coenzyme A synthetase/AMP-(fatty) acid ligase